MTSKQAAKFPTRYKAAILAAKTPSKVNVPKTDNKPVIAKEPSKTAKFIKATLEQSNVAYVCEHRFDKVRRFRFDFAIPSLMVAIEADGLQFGKSGKSRHTTAKGFTGDCDKLNLAALHGWRVFRYTILNYPQFAQDLHDILNPPKSGSLKEKAP